MRTQRPRNVRYAPWHHSSESGQDQVKLFILTPLTMTYRGQDPAITPHALQSLKLGVTTASINGRVCEEYVLAVNAESRLFCWFDPNSDNVVRRIRRTRNGKTASQTHIEYVENPEFGWTPTKWVRNTFAAAGTTETTTVVNVSSIRVNSGINLDRFRLEFPEGAHVHDQRSQKDTSEIRPIGRR